MAKLKLIKIIFILIKVDPFQRIERIESLRQSLKETRHDNENRLVGTFNNYLLAKSDLIESRKSNETWDRWLDQSGRPELLSAKGTFGLTFCEV